VPPPKLTIRPDGQASWSDVTIINPARPPGASADQASPAAARPPWPGPVRQALDSLTFGGGRGAGSSFAGAGGAGHPAPVLARSGPGGYEGAEGGTHVPALAYA
jgi:hypothetical protein